MDKEKRLEGGEKLFRIRKEGDIRKGVKDIKDNENLKEIEELNE